MEEIPGYPFQEHYSLKSVQQVARVLRRRMTVSEKILWSALRRRQLKGLKFLRQHPIGSSVVDFYCHEKRLAIEIDGGIHLQDDQRERDKYRQKLIEGYGIRFFRCQAAEVERDHDQVIKRLSHHIDELDHTD